MRPSPDRSLSILCLAIAPLVACAGPPREFTRADSGGAGSPGAQAGAGGLDISGAASGAGGSDAGTPLVYVVGWDSVDGTDGLWTLDPEHFDLPPVFVGHVGVGTYSSCGDGTTTDIAVDGAENIYSLNAKGTTTVLLRLVSGTDPVSCHVVTPLDDPLAQRHISAMPPTSSLAPGSVVVLDYFGSIFSIDPSSGATQKVGHLPPPGMGMQPGVYDSDIVLLDNGGAPIGFVVQYAADLNGRLIEIDVAAMGPSDPDLLLADRGELHPGPSCTDAETPAYAWGGLVAYGDKVYLLGQSGVGMGMEIFEVDTEDASMCPVAAVPTLTPRGAGITTLAPVIPPPK